jgi:hypothetical protein
MRTVPLVGHKPWFGPRRWGWGLGPISGEGWLVTGASVAATLVLSRRFPDRRVVRRLPAVALVVVAVAKGTAPGGPRARAALAEVGEGPAR